MGCWGFVFVLFQKMKDLEGNEKSFFKLVLLIEKLEKLVSGSPFLQDPDYIIFFIFLSALVTHQKLCSHCSNILCVPNPLLYFHLCQRNLPQLTPHSHQNHCYCYSFYMLTPASIIVFLILYKILHFMNFPVIVIAFKSTY